MTSTTFVAEHQHHDHQVDDKAIFGFWIYIMSDCILFASIFATYAVLKNNTYGGITSQQLFDMPYVLIETFILLSSSFSYGLVMLAAHQKQKNLSLLFLFITFLLGISFVAMEFHEFRNLILEGHGPDHSAFLSAYFTLVGTHGLHVSFGLIWMIILILQVTRHGINSITIRKLTCLSLFWHFLDIVWIFIFTIVYLMGVI